MNLYKKSLRGPVFDRGVAIHRLNPANAYHAIFEDMIPVWGMLRQAGNVSAEPTDALQGLTEHSRGLFVVDHMGANHLDEKFRQALLPEMKVIHPSQSRAYRVKTLIAGI